MLFIHYKYTFPQRCFKNIHSRKHIRKKHEKDIFDILRSFENLKTKYAKSLLDITFIKSCKTEHILPTFVKFRLSNKYVDIKLNQRIGRVIMENELERKYQEKRKLRKEIISISIQLKSSLTLLT